MFPVLTCAKAVRPSPASATNQISTRARDDLHIRDLLNFEWFFVSPWISPRSRETRPFAKTNRSPLSCIYAIADFRDECIANREELRCANGAGDRTDFWRMTAGQGVRRLAAVAAL